MTDKYFSYDVDNGFETFETAEQAKNAAQESLDYYRAEIDDGWHEDVARVRWGEITQAAEIVRQQITAEERIELCCPDDVTEFVDYQLADLKSESDSVCAEEKARQLAKELMSAMNALNASTVGFNHIVNGEAYRFSLTFDIARVADTDDVKHTGYVASDLELRAVSKASGITVQELYILNVASNKELIKHRVINYFSDHEIDEYMAQNGYAQGVVHAYVRGIYSNPELSVQDFSIFQRLEEMYGGCANDE